MRTLFALLIASSASVAAADAPAPGHAVEFSKYSSALTLVSYDKQSDTFNFRGTLKLVGTLFIEFAMASDRASGDITFEKFVAHGSQQFLSKRVSLTLHSYSASVECDSRTYLARAVSIAPLAPELFASLGAPPHGC
jgi:hypothetical protein